jgi:dolichol-phosphate mannosyltransferase
VTFLPYDLTVVIPTYNESENIEEIILKIDHIFSKNNIRGQILVVDDNSIDGTLQKVCGLIENRSTHARLNILSRYTNKGLSQSVIDGIHFSESDIIVVTDADMSHDINQIPDMYHEIKNGADIVIGSRYLDTGGIKDWPLFRRVISWGANSLARFFYPKLTDPVSGFFAIKKDIILTASNKLQNTNPVLQPSGYKILFEILSKCEYNRVIEIPYVFTDRKKGESKLRGNISKFSIQLFNITFYSIKQRNNPPWKELEKLLKFSAVGVSGIIVNMGILYVFTEYFGFYYIYSGLIAIVASICTNFILNDIWTFKGLNKRIKFHERFVLFFGIALGGLLINIGVLWFFTSRINLYYIYSNFIGILIAFIWNFILNSRITFKE